MKLILKCIYLLADCRLIVYRPTRPYFCCQYTGAETSTTTNACHCCCWFFCFLLFWFFFFFSLTRRHRVCLEFIFTRTRSPLHTQMHKHEAAYDEIRTLSRRHRESRGYVRVTLLLLLLLLRSTYNFCWKLKVVYCTTYLQKHQTSARLQLMCLYVCMCMCMCWLCVRECVCVASKCFVLLRDRVR